MREASIIFSVSFVGIFLTACAAGSPQDLALSSVKAVNYRTQKEIPPPSAALAGLVGIRNLPQLGISMNDSKPNREMLRIEFSSNVNLPKFAFQNGYTLFSIAFFCDDPNAETPEVGRIGLPDIYYEGVLLSKYDINPIKDYDKPPFKYYRYISVQSVIIRDKDDDKKEFYDLRKLPRDICLKVRGGNYYGFFETNTVIITRETIVEALRYNLLQP